ncbi:MAG: aminoacyl--tRNA ligase-related protein [Candidatus Magasanikbacteria bacterium]
MYQSKLFTKTLREAPKDEVSLNAQLLIRAGFIDKLMAGVYTFLPLGLRTLNKIQNIIREEINAVGGQEVLMPALNPKENWEKTGRWSGLDVLFKLEGAGDKEYALGASHEEVVTPLVQKFAVSHKDLPCAVYQIQNKFRNEPRAKAGLLRGREFSMKDLYSFHKDEKDLDGYYEKVKAAYFKIYERVGLGAITHLVFSSGGTFSKYSHEFQTITKYGEDTVYICEKCGVGVNKEIIAEQIICPECGGKDLKEEKAIEVGNIFKLMTKYSAAFDYNYIAEDGSKKPVMMGCYGIGPSRVMGTIAEVLHDENGIIWPQSVAPFNVHLVSFGKNGDEVAKTADKLYNDLTKRGVEVLYDDRDIGAGAKFADADLIGIPKRIVVSKKTLEQNSVEVKMRNEKENKLVNINKLF